MSLPDYQVTNDAGDVTVYLLHGIYGAKEYWRPVTKRLVARGYRVIAWDAPGYGMSKLPAELSFDAIAEAGAALVRATGGKRNVVFGHSMGGQITPRLVGKVADRVHAAVITATIGYFGNRTAAEQEEFVRKRSAPPPAGTDPLQQTLAVVNSMFHPESKGSDVDLVREIAMHTPPDTVKASVKAVQSYSSEDAVAAFRALSVPTLLVAGGDDQVGYPAGMQRVAEMISDSQFGVVPSSGHYPWAEQVPAFNEIFFGFLNKHFGTPIEVGNDPSE